MKTITFFRKQADLDAQARASGTPIPAKLEHARQIIDGLAKGKYDHVWLPHRYAMKWRHPDLNARNTQITFLGKYDRIDQWAVRDRLPD
jgi:hypothetical protein